VTTHSPRYSLLTLALAVGALAAEPPTPTLVRTQPKRAAEALAHLQGRLAAMAFPGEEQGVLLRAETDPAGRTANRFQHVYRGVKVWGDQWLVHQDAEGRFLDRQGDFQRVGRVSVKPTLQAGDALALAQGFMKNKGPLSVAPQVELVLVPSLQRVVAPHTHADLSLNARDVRHRVTGHELAYHVSLSVANDEDGVAQRDYLIQAHSGQVIRQWNSLETDAPAKGQGQSLYSGTVTLDTVQKEDGTFGLVDTTRGVRPNPITGLIGNATLDLGFTIPQDKVEFVPGTVFNDADDQWGDSRNYDWDAGETSGSANGQTAAVDAHFGLQTTWDTYKNVFHRDGIDDQGTSTFSRVHYGFQFTNAYWETSCFCMTYGDGSRGGPGWPGSNALTELDIAGHEMSHGVTAFSADLAYTDEMGGLNESSSDIMGKMVEFYAYGASAKGDTIPDTGGKWMVGWALSPGGSPGRWLYKPSLDGTSPDYWNPMLGNLDVHYSSGPNNRMFYFLSVGASALPTSDSHSPFLANGMSGIGNQKAGQIWYRALTHYMTPDTRYFGARKACIQAATDLFGELSPEYRAVQNAYAGINVGVAADGTKEDFARPIVQATHVRGTQGTVFFTTAASDDRGLASVDYFVDGSFAGTSTASDFQLPFDSSTVTNDEHVLTAVAYDTNQNASELATPLSFSVHNPRFEGIQNGGFEWGLSSWSVPADVPDQPYLLDFSHQGASSILFGAKWSEGPSLYLPFRSAMFQDVKLPTDFRTLTLQYWFLATPPSAMTPPPTDGNAHDTLTVKLLDASGNVLKVLGSHSNLDDTTTPDNPVWTLQIVDVSDLKGQRVRLQVESANDDKGYGTAFLVDDFALAGTSTVQPNAADLNADGVVDGYDLALLMAAFNPARTPSDSRADLNGDGVVDDKDLGLLLSAFGK
jgi:Zn-dependent metalloprotease